MRVNHLATATRVLLLAATASAPLFAVPDALQPCPTEQLSPDALCGTISVLEDRTNSSGRSIDLRVVVLPATGSVTREPLFLLAGGPGQGATDLIELVLGPFAAVRESRDMVLVDQRGTGSSNRIDCPIDADGSPQDVFGGLFDSHQMRECLEEIEQHADPTLYTSNQVVDDLDEVRAQLGYDKVLLWGGSGGTRTALIWMRRHPERVMGALLDGVAPSDFRAPSTMARGCQDTVDKMFVECREQESCNTAYPNLEEDFAGLLQLFENGPVATHILDRQGSQVPVEMHRGDFTYAVRGIIYRSRTLSQLPGLIHQAARTGDIQPFAQMYWQRQVGIRPLLAMGVHFAVYCSEDLPFIAPEEVAGFADDTFVGRYLYDQYHGVCQVWKATPVDRTFLEPVQSDIPVLVISGYYDPSTPASLGDAVASHLSNSRHIVVRNESHGAEFGCAREAAVQFLTTGSLEGLGPVCEDAGPVEYEVSP
jgi:pimeloyl-ACP methyl ester carboxylesterase